MQFDEQCDFASTCEEKQSRHRAMKNGNITCILPLNLFYYEIQN